MSNGFSLQDLVLLLVERKAEVNIRNGEGRTAREVGVEGGDANKLLAAAERTDLRRKEEALLSAARNGDLADISTIVMFHCENILFLTFSSILLLLLLNFSVKMGTAT